MLRQILIATFALILAAAPAAAQRTIEIPGIGTIQFGGGKNKQLDRRDIDRRFKVLDRKRNYNDEARVVFDVGRDQGRFTQLRLRAIGKVVRITDMEVVFGNGKSQKIDLYQAIYPGEVSNALDLSGDARGIRRVIITKRRTWQRERGEIELLGLPDNTRGGARIAAGPRFTPIGSERTGRRSGDVVFNDINGRKRWDEIRIRALDRRAQISDVVITFQNGDRQRVWLNTRLDRNEVSRIIPLNGRNARRIKSITVGVERRPGPRGRLQILGANTTGRANADVVPKPDPRRAGQRPVPKGWVLFGSETVGRREQRKVMKVGRAAGVFDRITFRALRNDVYIRDVTVIYGNGKRDRRTLDMVVPAGYGTEPIDLKIVRSTGRAINQIIVRLASEGRRIRWRADTALLQVYGEYSQAWLDRDHRGSNRWIRLGAREAAMFSKDTDVISVGKRFGRFRAIRARVLGNKIKLYGITVHYENGSSEPVPIYGTLRAGQTTNSFDLKGRKRFINRITLKYRTKFSLKGDAVVEIWGQK